jgi:exodeoxyribonuclease VII small subunit
MANAKDTPNADVAELSYEQAREQLVQVVSALEQGNATLEESMALWERGEALAAQCEKWLSGAKSRLDAALAAKKSAGAASDE